MPKPPASKRNSRDIESGDLIMQPNTPVGIIGLGLMGTALFERLIEAKVPLIGFDIEPTRREKLKASGGMVATSVRELAADPERLLLQSIVENRLKRCSASLRTPQALRGQSWSAQRPADLTKLPGLLGAQRAPAFRS